MAAGVPVIVAVRPDNFAGVDLVGEQCCILVPIDDSDALADALIGMLSNRSARERIGHAGRAAVEEHFTLDVVLARHLTTLQAMIDDAQREDKAELRT